VYPVDIQACAQSLLTAILFRRHCFKDDLSERITNGVLKYTLANLYDESGRFYYRKYPNRTDRNSFIRWGDAWMIRAISEYIYSYENDK
ncbi:MAG: hypothetical protein WBG42_17630, partial [Cryomorphaceae bacterium]